MKLLIIISVLLSCNFSLAKNKITKKSKDDANTIAKAIDKGFIEIKYKHLFLENFELPPMCIDVFEQLQFTLITSNQISELSKENLNLRGSAINLMKSYCYRAIKGMHIDFKHTPNIENAVDIGLISEYMYLYFIHTIAYDRLIKTPGDYKKANELLKEDISYAFLDLKVSPKYSKRLKEIYSELLTKYKK